MATAPTKLPVTEGHTASLKKRLSERLERARERTLLLIGGLSDETLNATHDALMSPIAWDLGHIASFEELWLVRTVGGRSAMNEQLGDVYDPFTTPRSERGELPFLRADDCLSYLAAVRERTLECLEKADLGEGAGRLLAGGFAHEMVIRHEQQHSETILQTLQIMSEPYEPPATVQTPRAASRPAGMVPVPGGAFEIGASDAGFAYDNERPGHARELAPFLIDAAPVTNGEYAEFVEAGGYSRRAWWSDAGWDWRRREGAEAPRYWTREGNGFAERRFGRVDALEPERPVCHVSFHEADAFARSRGLRLPTEAEWEMAASWDHRAGAKRLHPWGDDEAGEGRANLGQLAFSTAPVGAFPEGRSPCGAHQMEGDVWEWTASGFEAYDGFEAFPYAEYSQPFFGGPFKVLRGGSWATQGGAVTATFRNWDYPARRQIFSGFRCARDAEPGEVA